MKISVIGVGRVGSLVGFVLARRGLAREIVLCAREREESQKRAAAEALDIAHAVAFTSHRLDVHGGTVADTAGSDILVMTASAPMPLEMQDRMHLARENARLMDELVPPLIDASPEAIVVNVTNPLDVVTWKILEASGLGWRKVIGTGTLIDSARYRRLLSDELDINAVDINSYVLGEHGETQFAATSHASVGGERLARLLDAKKLRSEMISEAEEQVRTIGWKIFHARGYTNYAVTMAVEMVVENIVRDLCSTMPVSVKIDGFCDEHDVCLSLPCVIGRRGVRTRLEPELDAEEQTHFKESAGRVRQVIAAVSGDSLDSTDTRQPSGDAP